jgi:DNA-binding response OmpR family regulator
MLLRRQISSTERKRRAGVVILLGETQPSIGNALRASLVKEGFDHVQIFNRVGPIRKALDKVEPDLIVADLALPGGDICQLVRDIRESRIGANPFMPLILTAQHPSAASIRPAIEAGTDDIVAKPLSPGLLLARMSQIASARKPFVITSDYIGPDRRRGTAREGTGNPEDFFEVPNTFRAKLDNAEHDQDALARAVARGQREVNARRLRRHAAHVLRLTGEMIGAYRAEEATAETEEYAKRLCHLVEDALTRLDDSDCQDAGGVCRSLLKVARSVRRSHPTPNDRDLQLLPQLAEAVVLAVNPTTDTTKIVGEINSTIGAYLPPEARLTPASVSGAR